MGVYHTMQDMGLISSYRLYKGKRVDYKGEEQTALLVDIDYEGNIITLYSELPYSEEPQKVARSLEYTYLHSLKLAEQKVEARIGFSSVFSSDKSYAKVEDATVEYDGDKNIVLTSEGIYYFKEELERESDRRRKVGHLGRASIYEGLTDNIGKALEDFGGVKILDFKDNSNPESKLSIYDKLLSKGAVEVEELKYHQDRAKAFGHMYQGKGVLELDGITYYFKMWHHHSREEHMTEAEVRNTISLSGIQLDGKVLSKLFPDFPSTKGNDYYQLHENTFIHKNNIFFMTDKMTRGSILEKQVNELRDRVRIEGLTDELISELESMGFKKIL